MKTILAIQQLKKRPLRFDLVFSDGETISITEDTLVQFHLYKGKTLAQCEIENVLNEDLVFRCREQALRFLKIRHHLIKELTTKLAQKGFGETVIAAVIEKLDQKKLVDDSDYIRAFIHDQIHLRHNGPLLIGQKLYQRGLSAEEIEAALHLYYPQEQQAEQVKYWIGRKQGEQVTGREKEKLIRFLQQKGFSWTVLSSCLRPGETDF